MSDSDYDSEERRMKKGRRRTGEEEERGGEGGDKGEAESLEEVKKGEGHKEDYHRKKGQ